MIVEINKTIDCRPSKKLIKTILSQAFRAVRVKKKIKFLSVALVDKKEIRAVNKKYRQIDKPTDVLSFEDPPEIMICWEMLVKQAKEQKRRQGEELKILLIHGLLHILGYDHQTKKQGLLMEKKAKEIRSKISKPK